MYGNVQVYELASSATIEQAIKEISSSVCIQRCYLSSNGVDLIPNGYINVKLKSKSDFFETSSRCIQQWLRNHGARSVYAIMVYFEN